jgi:hypothetical protein
VIQAINYWNSNLAGKTDARGSILPALPVPTNFQTGHWVNTQDVRLSYTYTYKERYKLSIFGEAFNVLNVANLSGYNIVLNTATFGQPTARAQQILNSGGPRAFQVGGRVSF